METSEQTATNPDGTTGATKETPMNTAATTPERNTKWRFPALAASMAIGAAALLSVAVYGGYLWGGATDKAGEHAAAGGDAAPISADPETDVINLGE